MRITLNGQELQLDANTGITISDFLTGLGYQNHTVAVAINRECVLRKTFADTKIQDGDDVEILAPMAGG